MAPFTVTAWLALRRRDAGWPAISVDNPHSTVCVPTRGDGVELGVNVIVPDEKDVSWAYAPVDSAAAAADNTSAIRLLIEAIIEVLG